MIDYLSIKNYALIEDVRVELKPGLTIITGETGAGKSILLGALSLLLGNRADLGVIRDKSRKCIIEGQFSIAGYKLQELFAQNDLDYDKVTIIRREILPGGKSRSFVNDTPVNLNQLKPLGERLVDIHSQHDTLVLSSEAFQLEVIDAVAGHNALLDEYSGAYKLHGELTSRLRELKSSRDQANKESDYQTFLLNELREAQLEGIDLAEIEEEYQTLSNVEEIQESLAEAIARFDNEQVGIIEQLKVVRAALLRVKDIRQEYSEFWQRLDSSIIELEDLLDGLNDAAGMLEADPSRLALIDEKLQSIYRLERKHAVSGIEQLLEIQQDLEDQLKQQLDLGDQITAVEAQLKTTTDNAYRLAARLHNGRLKVIPVLKEKIEALLANLGLENARFSFELIEGETLRVRGTDTLNLLFSANKGSSQGPINKVASGGELSRIMLAVKSVLAEYKELPVIVFDEIDTGVSGEIANMMAAIMSQMSRDMQLISITHLPQVAAKGHHHFKVYKEEVDSRTQTRIKELDPQERLVEIAGMIGGARITETTLANARELLN
jgi:DNA repair protein RecN (Recombination protein N)